MLGLRMNLKVLPVLLALLIGFVCPQFALGADSRTEVIELIKAYYPDAVDPDIFERKSAADIVAGLNDPFSVYMSRDEFSGFMQDMDGSFSGVGLFIEKSPEGFVVVDNLPGSPAEAAGIKSGDLIIGIDHENVKHLTVDKAQAKLQGHEGSRVVLTVSRDARQFDVALKRAHLAMPSVRGLQLHDRVAYLAVWSFGSNTAQEMEHYITALDPASDQWIIDLRGNSGGYILTAAELAGFLMKVDNMVILQQKEKRIQLPVIPQSTMIAEPVIVLVDGYSASASELLAAALKDYQRVLLVGENTYGKGTMQEIFTLSNGNMLKLTVAEFFSPRGYKIHHQGVAPDVEIEAQQALDAAWLLLSQPAGGNSRAFIEAGGGKCVVDLDVARDDDCWEAWNGLTWNLDILNVECGLNAKAYPVTLDREDIVRHWPVYYPDYRLLGEYRELDHDRPVYLSIQGLNQNWPDCGYGLELIDSQTGQRISYDLHESGKLLTLQPLDISPGREYWLLWHGSPSAQNPSDTAPPAIAILQYHV